MAVLGLRFCARAFSSCGERGPLLIAVRGPLTIVASLVAEHRLQTRRLSNCGSQAQPLRGMWDPPRPGLEPVFPALAGRLSTTVPPGKPYLFFYTAGSYQSSILYTSVYTCQSQSPNSAHHHPHNPVAFPPWCPCICSLHLFLNFCPANQFICTIFLGSTCMR